MKNHHTATRPLGKAVAGVLPAMALFTTPALAQEAAQPAAAPVVQPAPPAAAPVVAAPAPAAPAATGPSDADRAKVEASAAAATGTAAAPADAAPAERVGRPARAATRSAPRAEQRAAPRAAAPAAAQPAAPTPAPVASEPAAPVTDSVTTPAPEAAAPPAAPVVDEPAAPTADTQATTTDTQATTGGVPTWAWLVGGLAIVGLALFALFGRRRRRDDAVWHDEAAAEPLSHEPVFERQAAAAPLAAAPLAAEPVAEQVEVVEPARDEVAAITEAAAPVAGRPWIELSLRPLRAGSTDDAAVVDLELTLANAGEFAARNVRVTTFMLGDASEESQMDRLLANGHARNEVDAGEIAAGQGSRVDATLTTPREGLEGSTFQPIVVADVRYTLPNGSEGRTAAAFAIGADDGTEDPTPLRLGGDMREDVSATLHGVLERA